MAAGIFDLDMEWRALTEVLETDDTPFRVQMVPRGLHKGQDGGAQQQLQAIKELPGAEPLIACDLTIMSSCSPTVDFSPN